MRGESAVTRMRDVAEAMGVSTTTVSNAFSRPDQLSVELRDRILSRAARMGYYGPHVAGRVLKQGRANAYGVIFMDPLSSAFDDPFKVAWLAGFTDALRPAGASCVLMNVLPTVEASARALRNTLVDGIAITWDRHPIMKMARAQGIPVVGGGAPGSSYVAVDELAVGRIVGEHLRSTGHHKVCVLTGPVSQPVDEPRVGSWREYEQSETPFEPWVRLCGLVDGLGDAAVLVAQATAWTRDAGRAAAGAMLDASGQVTAVACAGDLLALGAIDEAHARGITLGRELAVTGIDGIAETESNELTTVECHPRQQGETAAELLLDPARRPRRVVLEHQLVVRCSSTSDDGV